MPNIGLILRLVETSQNGDYNQRKVCPSKLLRDYHGGESKLTFSREIRQRVM